MDKDMKTLLLILLTSLSCLGQERVVLVHYNSHFAKIIEFKVANKKVTETILAEIENNSLFVYTTDCDKLMKIKDILRKKKHPKYAYIYGAKETGCGILELSYYGYKAN